MTLWSLLSPTNTGITEIELGSSSLHSKCPLYIEPPCLPESLCIFRDLWVIFKHAKVPLVIPGLGNLSLMKVFSVIWTLTQQLGCQKFIFTQNLSLVHVLASVT